MLFTAGGVERFGGERKEGFDAHGFEEGRRGGKGFGLGGYVGGDVAEIKKKFGGEVRN